MFTADFGVSTQLTKTFSKRNTFIGTPYWFVLDCSWQFLGWRLKWLQPSKQDPIMILKQMYGHWESLPLRWLRWRLPCLICIPCASCLVFLNLIRRHSRTRIIGIWWRRDWWHRSSGFQDFIRCCLTKDPETRPSAQDLLAVSLIKVASHWKHSFVKANDKSQTIIKELLERAREAKKQRALNRPPGQVASLQDLGPSRDDEDDEDLETDDQESGSGSIPSPFKSPLENVFDKLAVTSPTPPAPAAPDKAFTFKAERICRTALQINCAEFWGASLGWIHSWREYATFWCGWWALRFWAHGYVVSCCLIVVEKDAQLVPISNRKYIQLTVIEELGLIVSLSGISLPNLTIRQV